LVFTQLFWLLDLADFYALLSSFGGLQRHYGPQQATGQQPESAVRNRTML